MQEPAAARPEGGTAGTWGRESTWGKGSVRVRSVCWLWLVFVVCTGFVLLCLHRARQCCLCWLFFGASPVASPPPRFGVPSAAVPALSVCVQLITSCRVKSSREVLETIFKKNGNKCLFRKGSPVKGSKSFSVLFCLFVGSSVVVLLLGWVFLVCYQHIL